MDKQHLITLLDSALAAFPVEQAGHLPNGKPAYKVRLETGTTESMSKYLALNLSNQKAMRRALSQLHPDPLVAAEIMRPVLWSRGTPWNRRKAQNLRECRALEGCIASEKHRIACLQRDAEEKERKATKEAKRLAKEHAAEAKRLRESDPEYWL